jgi:hypothetical protein
MVLSQTLAQAIESLRRDLNLNAWQIRGSVHPSLVQIAAWSRGFIATEAD